MIVMKFDGIDGPIHAKGYENWIELHSFQWGIGRNINADFKVVSGPDPAVSEITVTKAWDQSCLPLLRDCVKWTPEHPARTVTIDFLVTNAGKSEPYLRFVLQKPAITGFSMSSGGDRPSIALSLRFARVDAHDMESVTKVGDAAGAVFAFDVPKSQSL